MKTKKSKWIPLGNYTYATVDYIVFARRNEKTGMVDFKTKKVHAGLQGFFGNTAHFIHPGLLDVKEQWEKIINAEKKEATDKKIMEILGAVLQTANEGGVKEGSVYYHIIKKLLNGDDIV